MDSVGGSSSNATLAVAVTVLAIGLALFVFTRSNGSGNSGKSGKSGNMGCGSSATAVDPTEASLSSNHSKASSASSAKPEPPKYPHGPLSIYFGSQTGTAEGFARALMQEGRKKGFDCRTVDCSEFDPSDLASSPLCIFLMATYGEGDPTDNAVNFITWLKDKEGELSPSQLSAVKFTVFGLGNKQYEHYNAMGRLVNRRLEELGAQRVYALGEGDDDNALEEDFEKWRADLWSAMLAAARESGDNSNTDANAASSDNDKVSLEFDVVVTPGGGVLTSSPVIHSSGKSEILRTASTTTTRRGRAGSFGVSKAAEGLHPSNRHLLSTRATLTEKRELRQGGEGSTLHLEVAVKAAGLDYLTADNLAVVPENPADLVRRMADRLGLSLNDSLQLIPREGESPTLPFPSPVSVNELFTLHVDLSGPVSMSLMKSLAGYVSNPAEKQWLLDVSARGNREQFKQTIEAAHLNVVTLIEKHLPSLNIPLSDLLHLLRAIQPRFYTISSSSTVHPDKAAMTVGVVENRSFGFTGQCTGYLQRLSVGSSIRVFVRESSFRLPALSVPVILVGPGTGIAPMRALAQERAAQRRTQLGVEAGPTVLYFGCRKEKEDFLYRDELEALLKEGGLTALHTAFSRDGPQKVYVQHLLLQQGAQLTDWLLNRSAYIFVCGATAMGNDVHAAFATLLQQHGNMNAEQAQSFLKEMQKNARYVQELWTA